MHLANNVGPKKSGRDEAVCALIPKNSRERLTQLSTFKKYFINQTKKKILLKKTTDVTTFSLSTIYFFPDIPLVPFTGPPFSHLCDRLVTLNFSRDLLFRDPFQSESPPPRGRAPHKGRVSRLPSSPLSNLSLHDSSPGQRV